VPTSSPVPVVPQAAAAKGPRGPQPVAESKRDDPKSRVAVQNVFQAKQAMKENVVFNDIKNAADDIEGDDDEEALHDTAQHIFEEEEALLNLHMNIIQENAELLTEEGRLLQQIQKDDNDIDAYAARLGAILDRKQNLIGILQNKLQSFRKALATEENVFKQTLGRR